MYIIWGIFINFLIISGRLKIVYDQNVKTFKRHKKAIIFNSVKCSFFGALYVLGQTSKCGS